MSYQSLQSTLGFTFKDPALLEQAFTHRSFLNETKESNLQSNERLEFLGDAVLELVTSQFLYQKLPQKPEGELTNLRSSLVKTETLSLVANELKLGHYLKMSKGEEQEGGRQNLSLLANTMEALIGAIYLDQGINAVVRFVNDHLFIRLPEIISKNLHHDFKSTLQEKVQALGQPTPTYHLIKEVGPDHHKQFTVEVRVDHTSLGIGTGSSKQKAETNAAKTALEKLVQK